MSVTRVLVANRGEIAVRVIKACRSLGIETVAAVSEADRDSLPARLADRAVCIGPARSFESYLQAGALVAAAAGTGCDALHPGYGFLAERAELAELCAEHHITFIGPTAENIRRMGDKLEARRIAAAAGVPTVPGSERAKNAVEAEALAAKIGYPILLKAAAGGGGRGIKLVRDAAELHGTFATAAAEARAAFGDDTLYLERYIANARHIEVQVLGDAFGHVIHLGERDCSLQRRHQKVIEEAPAYAVSPGVRSRICKAAATLARSIGYRNAGTVEFIFDADTDDFFFLEMNTRIQVEHPVTEMVTGVDLVAQQLMIARGQPLALKQSDVRVRGHAVECRINAESPRHGFRPCPGRITKWEPPQGAGIRLDTHCYGGYVVPPFYDSLLAKLIVHGSDRGDATARARRALASFEVAGIDTGIPFLQAVMDDPDYLAGRVNTRWLEEKLEAYAAAAAA
ncbi:MAG TPA: acetyl-CoA carboxylase biotin carboxylase subunit [candidate division Zixibacteria bacterium]|nr:acetyl-CoA carboxylase biotin carboxylase subunit [candidate division Zixibacteria bacterium]